MSKINTFIIVAIVFMAVIFWPESNTTEANEDAFLVAKTTAVDLPAAKTDVVVDNTKKQHKDKYIPVEECKNKINTALIDHAWKDTNNQWLINRLKHLGKVTPEPILYKTFIESGVKLLIGRIISEIYVDNFKPNYRKVKAKLLRPLEYWQLKGIADKNDVVALKQFIQLRSKTESVAVNTKDDLLYLLGYLLLNVDDKNQVVDMYLAEKLPIEMYDLVIASRQGVDVERLSDMYQHSGLDASIVLKHSGRHSSLVLESLKHQHYEQARYWINMGSPINPDKFYDNALDVLVKKAPEQLNDQWLSIVIELLDDGGSPLWPHSIKKLKNILDENIYAKYSAQLRPYQNELSREEINKARIISYRIHKHIIKNSAHFVDDAPSKGKCFRYIGKQLVKVLIDYEYDKIVNPEKVQPKPKPKSIDQQRVEALIAEAEEKFTTREEVEKYLGGEQSVENKKAVEKYRLKKYVDDANALALQNPDAKPIADNAVEIMNIIMKLAREGKWDEAVALLKQQDIDQQDMLNTLMIIAIYSPPDLAITQQLLDDGAKVPEDAINWFARKNDVARAKQMLPYGLKLYLRKGHLSSTIMAIKSKSFDILKFMLENGVSLDANDMGMDELDYALINYTKDSNGGRYIDLLFEHGAKVENSHRQLVEDIQRKNLVAYANLISNWPILGKVEEKEQG